MPYEKTASESGRKDGVRIFKARSCILRCVDGNVSFSIIHILKVAHSLLC